MAGEAGSGSGELGALMPKEPNAPENSWMALLKSPFVQGAAQALASGNMTGGNALREVLGSTAYGSQSEQLTEQNQYARKQEEQARSDKLSENAANRASHEKIGKMAADSRLEVANARVAGMLERSAMIHGPRNDAEWKFLQGEKKRIAGTINATIGDLNVSSEQKEQMIEARAKESLAKAREQGLFGGARTNLGMGEGETSATPSATGTPGSPSPTPEKAAPTAKGTPSKPTIDPIQELINKVGEKQWQESVQKPEVRQGLRAKGHGAWVDFYEKAARLPSTKPLEDRPGYGMSTGGVSP